MGVRHVEFAWAPELYCFRETNAITVEQQLEGLNRAFNEAKEKFNITTLLIMTFVRHNPIENCYKVLELTEPYKNQIAGVGLAGCEQGFGPELFQEVFKVSKEKYGYKLTAHAGEVTDSKCVKDTIDLLKVDRIDHGIQSMHDKELLQSIIDTKMHLTLCPNSNVILKAFSDIDELPLRDFYDRGVHFSINSDDPPFFNASLIENYYMLVKAKTFNFTKAEWINIAKMGFEGSFLSEEQKQLYYAELEVYAASHNVILEK